jgi:hypothetical protein
MSISKEDLRPPPIDLPELLKFEGDEVVNALIECEKYIFAIEDAVSIDRRLRFLLYDIEHYFQSSPPSSKELLTHLLVHRGLNPVDDGDANIQCFRVSNICHRKAISHSLLSLVLGSLLTKYRAPFVPFLCNGEILFRIQDQGRNVFLDWNQPEKLLETDALLARMNQQNSVKAVLEPYNPFSLLMRYLRKLKIRLQLEGYGPEYLRTLNILIISNAEKYRSIELVERGLFLEKVAYNKEALKDLKRYFNFCKSPEDNTMIYQTYQKLLSLAEKEKPKTL